MEGNTRNVTNIHIDVMCPLAKKKRTKWPINCAALEIERSRTRPMASLAIPWITTDAKAITLIRALMLPTDEEDSESD
jgi:hypothetical protein